jgi:hypothetical protein
VAKAIDSLEKKDLKKIIKASLKDFGSLSKKDKLSLFDFFKALVSDIDCFVTENDLILNHKKEIEKRTKKFKVISLEEFMEHVKKAEAKAIEKHLEDGMYG